MEPPVLTPVEARVLAVLVEKAATVPDTYPLSLNALVAGCNQKTARQPVMNLADDEVLQALDALKRRALVVEVSGNRVVRFEHNMGRALQLPSQSVALLAVLMLRGPQTSAELRLNAERLHRFADISSVEGFLDELAAKAPPRVTRLPRMPGEREARWAERLTDPADATPGPRAPEPAAAALLPADSAAAREPSQPREPPQPPARPSALRFALPAQLRHVHTVTVPLRWADMDAMGHVNNALYFRLMEVCRLDWLASLGVTLSPVHAGPVVINAFCSFLRPLVFPGDVRVSLHLGDSGRSSLDTFHTLARADAPERVFAEGGARLVWVAGSEGGSVPLPEALRQRLGLGPGPGQGMTE